jgi:hypothetical protein
LAGPAAALLLLLLSACPLPTPRSSAGLHCGTTDDCGAGFHCVGGTCLAASCGATSCADSSGCQDGQCVEAACVAVKCAADTACARGTCVATHCGAIECGANAVCDTGACVSLACFGVVCPAQQLCAAGVCTASSCGATPCASGEVCFNGACAEAACVGVICASGTSCHSGRCSGACDSQVNLQTDPDNCGQCGRRCAVPLHAQKSCAAGVCQRTACESGYFDIDRDATWGCEAACTGATCTLPGGVTVTFSAPPLPEAGLTWSAVSSVAAVGAQVQASTTHVNQGIAGEPTPALPGGAVSSASATHKNTGGFTSALQLGTGP